MRARAALGKVNGSTGFIVTNPKVGFDSKVSSDFSGDQSGHMVRFASFDAHEHLITRGSGLTNYTEPSSNAQRRIGDIIYIYAIAATSDAEPQYPIGVHDYAAHETLRAAWLAEGYGDFFQSVFPFKWGAIRDTGAVGGVYTSSPIADHFTVRDAVVTKNLTTEEQVEAHAIDLGQQVGALALDLAGSSRITALYVNVYDHPSFYDTVRNAIGNDHVIVSPGIAHNFPAPDTNTSVLLTENPYGRIPRDTDGNSIAIDNSAEGLALTDFYTNLYDSTKTNGVVNDFSDSFPARLYAEVQAFGASVYIPYLRRFDITPEVNPETPF